MSAGKHASDLAAADARHSRERAQHAQQTNQQAARHAAQMLELQCQLDEAVRYSTPTMYLCACLAAWRMKFSHKRVQITTLPAVCCEAAAGRSVLQKAGMIGIMQCNA